MNTYTETLVGKYINKNELLADLETDIAMGKLSAVTGHLLIRYVLNLPEVDAAEIAKDKALLKKVFQEIENVLIPAAITMGATFRGLAEIVKEANDE